jgi:hypothetical protein
MILGLIGRLVKTVTDKSTSYMAGPGGEVYFWDQNPWRRVPIYVHQATKTVWHLPKINAWWRSEYTILKAMGETSNKIECRDNIDVIEPGMFASGLLRIALEGRKLDMVELGGKYFERTDVELKYEGKPISRTSFVCMQDVTGTI